MILFLKGKATNLAGTPKASAPRIQYPTYLKAPPPVLLAYITPPIAPITKRGDWLFAPARAARKARRLCTRSTAPPLQ